MSIENPQFWFVSVRPPRKNSFLTTMKAAPTQRRLLVVYSYVNPTLSPVLQLLIGA